MTGPEAAVEITKMIMQFLFWVGVILLVIGILKRPDS